MAMAMAWPNFMHNLWNIINGNANVNAKAQGN